MCVAHVLRLTPNNIVNNFVVSKGPNMLWFLQPHNLEYFFTHTLSKAHIEDYQYIEDTLLDTHKKTLRNCDIFLSKVFLVACGLSPRKKCKSYLMDCMCHFTDIDSTY